MQNSTTENKSITFKKQLNGYNMSQVDRYVWELNCAYKTAYDVYNDKCAEYNDLLLNYERYKTQEQNQQNTRLTSDTLYNAEMLAQKILEEAHAEAARIKADIHADADRIKENARLERAVAKMEAQKIHDEANANAASINEEAQKIIAAGGIEMVEAKEKAQKIINDANANAARVELQAKRNLDQINGIIKQTIGEMQGLLLPDTVDATDAERKVNLQNIVRYASLESEAVGCESA